MPSEIESVALWIVVAATAVQTLLVVTPALWLSTAYAAELLRDHDDAPWYERARLGWPVQRHYTFAYTISLCTLMAWQLLLWRRDEGAAHGNVAAWTTMVVIIAMMICFGRSIGRKLHGEAKPWRVSLNSAAFTWLSQWMLLPILLFAQQFAPPTFDSRAGLLFAVVSTAVVALHCGGSLMLLRLFRVAVAPSEKTRTAVRSAAVRSGVAAPPTYEVNVWPANAWAFPASGQVCVARRLAEVLEPDELEAILLHEVGHLQESRTDVAMRLAVLPLVSAGALVPPIVYQYRVPGLLLYLTAVYVGVIWSRRVGHRLEHKADEFSRRCAASPSVYARALEKGYRLNLVPAVIQQVSPPHPELYDRMIAAGVRPDYDRPEPPSRGRAMFANLMFAVVMLVSLFVTEFAGFAALRYPTPAVAIPPHPIDKS